MLFNFNCVLAVMWLFVFYAYFSRCRDCSVFCDNGISG